MVQLARLFNEEYPVLNICQLAHCVRVVGQPGWDILESATACKYEASGALGMRA